MNDLIGASTGFRFSQCDLCLFVSGYFCSFHTWAVPSRTYISLSIEVQAPCHLDRRFFLGPNFGVTEWHGLVVSRYYLIWSINTSCKLPHVGVNIVWDPGIRSRLTQGRISCLSIHKKCSTNHLISMEACSRPRCQPKESGLFFLSLRGIFRPILQLTHKKKTELFLWSVDQLASIHGSDVRSQGIHREGRTSGQLLAIDEPPHLLRPKF